MEMMLRLRKLKAPMIIIRQQRSMVARAAMGVVFPSLENWVRRRKQQEFYDGLCRQMDGWAWCKLDQGHSGMCVFDWETAVDQLRGLIQ